AQLRATSPATAIKRKARRSFTNRTTECIRGRYRPGHASAIALGEIPMQSLRVIAPDVSVLLPYRDAAPTLAEAVTSILAERGVALELVAVDDGSHDEGPRYVESLAAADPRVRSVRSAPRGIVHALNVAIEHARAPFLARMDA